MTERIRINGQPIDKEKFADYFWEVYNTSKKNSCPEFRFPEQAPYFKFLTILAFNIFLKEKVDVAIIEGKYSAKYLYIIRNGISSVIRNIFPELVKSLIIQSELEVHTIAQILFEIPLHVV